MNRRAFVTGLATVLAAPLGAQAQQAAKAWRVGILATANPRVYDDFADELRKLGYNSQNLSLDIRNAEGKVERLPTLAAELVRSRADVILAAGGEAPLRAVRQATTTVPIVIVAVDYDPLTLGHVASLARPGGNVTGVFLQQLELTAKRLELLKATLPTLTRVAILWERTGGDQFKVADAASRSLGLRAESLEVQNPPGGLRAAFAMAAKDRPDALLVITTAVLFRERSQIAQLAWDNRLPAMYTLREFVEAGGLMSYGSSLPEMLRRAALYVDKILKGAKPADLPLEQPTKFELVINLKTAKALGLTIPPSLLLRADHVIE